jgi:carbon monoxide dehydrogenase subunit G
MNRTVEVQTHIQNTPEAVISFIGDVRNRTQYVEALKSITDVQGDPSIGQTWKWRFEALGMEFEGTARSVDYEPGQLYAFATEGGAESTWLYRADPDGDGTRLTLRVEYTLPQDALSHLPPGTDPEAMEKAEAGKVFQKLKAILDR